MGPPAPLVLTPLDPYCVLVVVFIVFSAVQAPFSCRESNWCGDLKNGVKRDNNRVNSFFKKKLCVVDVYPSNYSEFSLVT